MKQSQHTPGPDLLEAAELIIKGLEESGETTACNNGGYNALKAAIAKARGQS